MKGFKNLKNIGLNYRLEAEFVSPCVMRAFEDGFNDGDWIEDADFEGSKGELWHCMPLMFAGYCPTLETVRFLDRSTFVVKNGKVVEVVDENINVPGLYPFEEENLVARYPYTAWKSWPLFHATKIR